MDHLLPIIVDGAAVDVCYRCFKTHETENEGAPIAEVRSQKFFVACCKHFRHCGNERIPECKHNIAERASATAQKVQRYGEGRRGRG